MIEQLNLFAEPTPQPESMPTEPQAHPLAGTWWRPVSEYRYNENGRPSGWVKVTNKDIACIGFSKLKHRLSAEYFSEYNGRYYSSGWYWINEKDLRMYFEQIPKPEWVKAWE